MDFFLMSISIKYSHDILFDWTLKHIFAQNIEDDWEWLRMDCWNDYINQYKKWGVEDTVPIKSIDPLGDFHVLLPYNSES